MALATTAMLNDERFFMEEAFWVVAVADMVA